MGESSEEGAGAVPEGTARRRGLLGGIIRTTKATATNLTPQDASVAARKCRSCGAGRPEDTDLRVCAYCGDRFMTEDAATGLDPDPSTPDS